MDKSGANSNNRCNQRRARGTAPGAPLTYLNNIVEQDQCAIKRVRRPMLNFKSFRGAGILVSSRRRFCWPINAWQETGMNADRPWLGNLHLCLTSSPTRRAAAMSCTDPLRTPGHTGLIPTTPATSPDTAAQTRSTPASPADHHRQSLPRPEASATWRCGHPGRAPAPDANPPAHVHARSP